MWNSWFFLPSFLPWGWFPSFEQVLTWEGAEFSKSIGLGWFKKGIWRILSAFWEIWKFWPNNYCGLLDLCGPQAAPHHQVELPLQKGQLEGRDARGLHRGLHRSHGLPSVWQRHGLQLLRGWDRHDHHASALRGAGHAPGMLFSVVAGFTLMTMKTKYHL